MGQMEAVRMSADSQGAEGAITAALEGELDRAVYGEKLRQIRQLYSASPGDVSIDCARLSRISPMAVAALVRFREFVESEGHALRIVNVSPSVASAFSRGGLEADSIAAARPDPVEEPPSAPEAPAAEVPVKPRLEPPPSSSPEPPLPPAPAPEPVPRPTAGANLVGEVERLKHDLALMEADLAAAREEAETAAGDREKAQSLYVDLRARVEALREENRKLAEEQEAIRQRSQDALAPMREVQKRIRDSLEQARQHADSLAAICRGVEEALLTVGVAVPPPGAEPAAGGEPPLSHLILSAMVKMDPKLGELFRTLRVDLDAADEKIRRQASLFANLGEEKAPPSA